MNRQPTPPFLWMTTCCCCCNLRTGAMAIAVLNVVGASLSVLRFILKLCAVPAGQYLNYTANFGINVPMRESLAGLIVGLVFGIFYLATCASLCIGIMKRKDMFVKPWLVVEALALFINIGSTIYGSWLIMSKESNHKSVGGVLIIFLIIMILAIGLSIYFWLVILAYTHELLVLGSSSSDIINKDRDPNNVQLQNRPIP